MCVRGSPDGVAIAMVDLTTSHMSEVSLSDSYIGPNWLKRAWNSIVVHAVTIRRRWHRIRVHSVQPCCWLQLASVDSGATAK